MSKWAGCEKQPGQNVLLLDESLVDMAFGPCGLARTWSGPVAESRPH